jgi:hypothetical protein
LNEQNGAAEARHAVPRRPQPRRLILGSLAIASEATLHTRGVASLFVCDDNYNAPLTTIKITH